MSYYKPYKPGVMNRNQARVMAAVGDSANLRKIMNGTGFKSAQAVASLVESLVKSEVLQAINV
jgi:hypothetical protein